MLAIFCVCASAGGGERENGENEREKEFVVWGRDQRQKELTKKRSVDTRESGARGPFRSRDFGRCARESPSETLSTQKTKNNKIPSARQEKTIKRERETERKEKNNLSEEKQGEGGGESKFLSFLSFSFPFSDLIFRNAFV